MKNSIRIRRAEHRLSQEKLAELAGVSRQAINAIENEKHEPSISLAFRIAFALGSEITDVFHPDELSE